MTSLLISILLISNIYIIIKLSSVKELLFNHIYNNTKTLLLKVLHDEVDLLTKRTLCERVLMCYFSTKLEIVYNGYELMKDSENYTLLGSNQFKMQFLGDGRNELEKEYEFFPEEFLSKINSINEDDFEQFISNMRSAGLGKKLNKKERLSILKTHTVNSFEKNIKKIYKAYCETRHLIQDKEYQDVYPELFRKDTVILSEETKTEYFTIQSHFKLEKEKLRQLITIGIHGLEQALYILNTFSGDKELNKDVIMLLNRLNIYNQNMRRGIENPDCELNKITQSTIEIIDLL